MKKIVLIILIIALGIYGNNVLSNNPSVITNPVYVETRLNVKVPNTSRELDFVYMGEMVSQDDCLERSRLYLENLFEKCAQCTMNMLECKTQIHSRYKKLFSGSKAHTTYLSLNKGNRFERNGRMVVWGLTDKEANSACNDMKNQIKEKYSGTVRCVSGYSL